MIVGMKFVLICPNLRYKLYHLEAQTELNVPEKVMNEGTVKETRISHLRSLLSY